LATIEIPPLPAVWLSAAASNLRDRSSKTVFRASKRAVIEETSVHCDQYTPKHFIVDMLFLDRSLVPQSGLTRLLARAIRMHLP
jgi:hypothetical protein